MAGIFTAIHKVIFIGEDMITGTIWTDHTLEECTMTAGNTMTGGMDIKDIITGKTAVGKTESPLTFILSQRAFLIN